MKQQSLFPQSKKITIAVDEKHELVRLAEMLDWDELIEKAMDIRGEKIIRDTGSPPHYRELLGVVAMMAVKNMPYREAEDQVAHYVPARYLCNLMDTRWSPDHVTIFEFTEMLGAKGMSEINRQVLQMAKRCGFADPTSLMSDTTAQEAKIPYPNEVGLMSRFMQLVERNVKKAGKPFAQVGEKIKEVKEKVKGLVRNVHLFAKTKETKTKVTKKLGLKIAEIQTELKNAVALAVEGKSKVVKELVRLSDVMDTLLPQIWHFIRTGFVAPKKIIHITMTELYSIVRGKAGKNVEFGLKWGINRIKGGFVSGFLFQGGKHVSDGRFCLEAIKIHREQFGNVPKEYGFDRGGYSKLNIREVQKLGVAKVGIAPKGQARWVVSDRVANRIKRERAKVEGCIGTLKTTRYGFNRPNARSTGAMELLGQRSFIGFNLRKLVREQVKLETSLATV